MMSKENTPITSEPSERNALLQMALGLLRTAKCPNESCQDGSIAVLLGEHFVSHEMAMDAGEPSMEGSSMGIEWGQEQCQWCDERNQLLSSPAPESEGAAGETNFSGGLSEPEVQPKGDLHINRNADTWNGSDEIGEVQRGLQDRKAAASPNSSAPPTENNLSVPVLAEKPKPLPSEKVGDEAREKQRELERPTLDTNKDSRGAQNSPAPVESNPQLAAAEELPQGATEEEVVRALTEIEAYFRGKACADCADAIKAGLIVIARHRPQLAAAEEKMQIPVNSERDNWRDITSEDATAAELHLVHLISGGKPDWITDANWRDNMRACAKDIREHVAHHSAAKDAEIAELKASHDTRRLDWLIKSCGFTHYETKRKRIEFMWETDGYQINAREAIDAAMAELKKELGK